MLGDTAVAVHPDDERYRGIVGKMLRHPILGYELPVIADHILVDMSFGTGAVKVTPGHDFNDFATGIRHNLREINILNPDGTLNAATGKFKGMEVAAGRKAVKEEIEKLGLFRGRKDHLMNIGRCQRCGRVVEPMLSTQWYVRMKPLAEPAIEAVEKGIVKIVPENWSKTYFHWMRNIQDWCISRQLWWGHQIPAWYCRDCSGSTDGSLGGLGSGSEPIVAREKPERCPKCGGKNLDQDPDVLDTWFSSGLWPFSTLGWPDRTADLEAYYPNTLMETGFDILFFWVARMMMMGIKLVHPPDVPLEKRVPFRTIYLHAMVRDEKGEKMSKTRGNVIDPLDVTKQHGADALRFTLASMAAQGHDVKLSIDRVEGYRHFCNKLWNAARFVMMNLGDYNPGASAPAAGVYERWIEGRLSETAAQANEALSSYRFDEAANAIYHFTWREFCDWYLELSKLTLHGQDGQTAKAQTQATLVRVLDGVLRLLHPFMPFITEEIWQSIRALVPGAPQSLALAPYPRGGDVAASGTDEVALLQELVTGIRNVRGEHNIEPGRKFGAVATAGDAKTAAALKVISPAAVRLAGLSGIEIRTGEPEKPAGSISLKITARPVDIVIPAAELIDFEEEEARLKKEISKSEAEIGGLEKRLNNAGFLEKAPAAVIAKDTKRLEELKLKSSAAKAALSDLEKMKG
jgi:valyl-tRNA synthetase